MNQSAIVLLILFLLVSPAVAQQYQQQIDSLDLAIEQAVAQEDFEQAALLKEQSKLYQALQQALGSKDFERAAQLKKQINAMSTSSNSDDCLVIFFAGTDLGRIGGYIQLKNHKDLAIQAEEVKTLHLAAGPWRMTTNKSETHDVIERNLEAGKVYFVEFNNKLGMNVRRPTFRFVSEEVFRRLASYEASIPEGYTPADQGLTGGKFRLNLIFENNCKRCVLEINGEAQVEGLDKKTIYTTTVDATDVVVTIDEALRYDQGSKVMFLNHTTLDIRGDTYLYIDEESAGMALKNFVFKEWDQATFQQETTKYKTVKLGRE